jgi:hypothetical protein
MGVTGTCGDSLMRVLLSISSIQTTLASALLDLLPEISNSDSIRQATTQSGSRELNPDLIISQLKW